MAVSKETRIMNFWLLLSRYKGYYASEILKALETQSIAPHEFDELLGKDETKEYLRTLDGKKFLAFLGSQNLSAIARLPEPLKLLKWRKFIDCLHSLETRLAGYFKIKNRQTRHDEELADELLKIYETELQTLIDHTARGPDKEEKMLWDRLVDTKKQVANVYTVLKPENGADSDQ